MVEDDEGGDVVAGMRAVCVPCSREYTCFENGFKVLEMADFGPYRVTESDAWKCPGCGHVVVTGFAKEGVEHYDADFHAAMARFDQTPEIHKVTLY